MAYPIGRRGWRRRVLPVTAPRWWPRKRGWWRSPPGWESTVRAVMALLRRTCAARPETPRGHCCLPGSRALPLPVRWAQVVAVIGRRRTPQARPRATLASRGFRVRPSGRALVSRVPVGASPVLPVITPTPMWRRIRGTTMSCARVVIPEAGCRQVRRDAGWQWSPHVSPVTGKSKTWGCRISRCSDPTGSGKVWRGRSGKSPFQPPGFSI